MIEFRGLLLKLILLLTLSCQTESSNILAIFPTVFRSHDIFARSLLTGLAKVGHNITFYTRYPSPTETINLHQISLKECFRQRSSEMEFQIPESPFAMFKLIRAGILPAHEELIRCTPFLDLMNTTQQFEVLLTSMVDSEWHIAYAHKFGIPMVNVFPNMLLPPVADRVMELHSNHMPVYGSGCARKMEFWCRVRNMYVLMAYRYYWPYYLHRISEDLKTMMFGDSVPTLYEIARNTSLTLVNTHYSVQRPMPLPQHVIPVGGLSISPQVPPLPQHIEKFINDSQHGIIFFSMGSLVKGELFSQEKRKAFLHAFSKIPQRVLWKWDGEDIIDKSDKILISKWMPQRSILAHPKTKLFISHGGLLSSNEAVYEGVPVLGIPIFGDQPINIGDMWAHGAAELLEFKEISNDSVTEAIQKMLNDPRYKVNAKKLSLAFRERLVSPMDTAIYWVEYVIRNQGAPLLRPTFVEMSWYEYNNLDIMAIGLIAALSAIASVYYITRLVVYFLKLSIVGTSSSKSKVKFAKMKHN